MRLNNDGNSLIEVIIAIAIFTWMASSLTSLILGSFSLLSSAGNFSQAEFLAQEGLEASRAIRNRAWNELNIEKSAVQIENSAWKFAGENSSEQRGIFTRTLYLSDVYRNSSLEIVSSTSPEAKIDDYSKKVKAEVKWLSPRKKQNQVAFSTILTNWKSLDWEQSDWSGGDGQDEWSEDDLFLTQDDNIDITNNGELRLLETATGTLAELGQLESSAFFMGQYSQINSVIWEGTIAEDCEDCLVKIQIKTAEDQFGSPTDWSNTWCGPNGEDANDDDYFSSTSTAELVSIDHNGDQWLKYLITLKGDTENTPIVNSLKFNYKK